jgi:putative transposase
VHHKAFKTQLVINNKQETLLKQHLGCTRWAYNWALSKKKEAFEAYKADKSVKIPTAFVLDKEFNKLKKAELPWMYDSSAIVTQQAIQDCDKAFKNFFDKCKKKTKGKKGFPKFKSKKNEKRAFRLNGPLVKIIDGKIQLPKIGKIKLAQKDYIPTNCKILSATVSQRAGQWFVSVSTEQPDSEPTIAKNDLVGVDLGIKNLATLSTGEVFANPKALKSNLRKLKKRQKQASKKQKGSKNYTKANLKLARLHYKISNIRKDCLHKITSKIVAESQVIVLEDLKVKNMLKNHNLAQAISDVGFYEFRRQIEYKAKWYGRQVVIADTFYASSKLCSFCGWKNEKLSLKDRTFYCRSCENSIGRDLNAALNLAKYKPNSGSSSRIKACGEGSAAVLNPLSPFTKQESTSSAFGRA